MKRFIAFHDGTVWGEFDSWFSVGSAPPPEGGYVLDRGFSDVQPHRWFVVRAGIFPVNPGEVPAWVRAALLLLS